MTLRVVPEGLAATSAAVEALTARLAAAHAAGDGGVGQQVADDDAGDGAEEELGHRHPEQGGEGEPEEADEDDGDDPQHQEAAHGEPPGPAGQVELLLQGLGALLVVPGGETASPTIQGRPEDPIEERQGHLHLGQALDGAPGLGELGEAGFQEVRLGRPGLTEPEDHEGHRAG